METTSNLQASMPSSSGSRISFFSTSSPRAVSMAFQRLNVKRSPSLVLTTGAIECTSANASEFLLQPKPGPLNGVFVEDEKPKKDGKHEDTKIKSIQQRLHQQGVTVFKEPDVSYAITTPYAKGDEDKAYELLSLVADSEEGIIHPYRSDVKLLGAINREGVTCFLDSLLFAMFARLGSFEAMLFQDFEQEPQRRLATLLRLWVNILRAGKLITTDITKQIQLQLASCGWKEAAILCQHDASEAFTFITATLTLPLLTLKMDIFHTGKEDKADDHKFINERLLELAIPEEVDGPQSVTLEDCLEMYFNNKIEVRRYMDELERRNTVSSVRSKSSLDSSKALATHVTISELSESQPSTPLSPQPQPIPSPMSPARPSLGRRRAPSIIQDYYIDEKQSLPSSGNEGSRSRFRKEVMMPAWQFFQLIPWYTNNKPTNDAQVAAHFSSTRPILGVCLKRYGMLPNGTAFKRKTHVDIPLEIGLPHFISDDDMSDGAPAFGNFKLSLQSFVCHEGTSVDSGHYRSFVRSPDPNKQGEDQWMRFDDLAKERVIDVSIEESLRRESPYLLFYQVIPIEEPLSTPSGQDAAFEEAPPSYAESNASHRAMSSTESSVVFSQSEDSRKQRQSTDTTFSEDEKKGPSHRSVVSRNQSDQGSIENAISSAGPSIEIARPENNGDTSLVTTKSISKSSLEGPPIDDPSRRGSNVSKTSNKSRPTSSSGERKLNVGLSKLTTRLSGDKLRNAANNIQSADNLTALPQLSEKETPAERARLKKETKEKSKHGLREHYLLGKGKKPERECILM